ncbi:long-chain-fatty-acid--CoA ligase [Thermoplasmatales archaeon SW_10_69_26]|nr:MAG: long-chain-fatty-acid--CoA ligase [Thermoplasmatales archaeon SW_10_69_26]
MGNLVETIVEQARESPDRDAMVFRGETWTYEELVGAIDAFAGGLTERGFEGSRVALYLPNVPPFVIGFHGTLQAGGQVVPMNPQYRAREIEHLLADSGAEVVVTLTDLAPVVRKVASATDVEEIVTIDGTSDDTTGFRAFLGDPGNAMADVDGDELAVLPYTSGTTGRPKGVQLSHDNLAGNAKQMVQALPDGVRPSDRVLGVLPLFHIYGMNVVMNVALFGGGTFYPLPAWDVDEAVDLIEDAELTFLNGVPAMFNEIVNHPEADTFDLSSVRFAGVGGAGIPREVATSFEETFDIKLYEGYGLTETSPVTHFNSPNWGRRVGSIGKTLPGIQAEIVDGSFTEVPPVEEGPVDEEAADLDEITGELVVAGPNVMKGYLGLGEANEDAFTEAGGTRWFHTGDLGYHDEDGFFYVVDRKKHMILSKGYNVYPREVEELLFEHPEIADAAVVGKPDEEYGELVKAFVVPTPDADLDPDGVQEFALANLAPYKHPREVEVVDELPRTTTGKVKKHELTG